MGWGYYPWYSFRLYVCDGGMMTNQHDFPDVKNYKCYKLGQQLYVPHYSQPGLYVAPSIRKENIYRNKVEYYARTFYGAELTKMGAIQVMEQLWETKARNE